MFVAIGSFTGCDGAIDSEYTEQIVVQGFIYPGEAIDSVILHYTVPFTASYNDSAFAVTNADVRVGVDGKEYVLQASAKRGRYFLPKADLIIQGGKTYTLTLRIGNKIISATTTVPMPILYTNLSKTFPDGKSLTLDTNNATTFSYTLTAGPIDVASRKYMLQVSALDTTVGKIFTGQQGPPVDTSAYVRYSFIQTAPRIIIYSRLFGWFGPNRLTILALDSNWVDYKRAVGYGDNAFIPYQSSLNHINGGIGIWASAAKDEVTVFLKPKP